MVALRLFFEGFCPQKKDGDTTRECLCHLPTAISFSTAIVYLHSTTPPKSSPFVGEDFLYEGFCPQKKDGHTISPITPICSTPNRNYRSYKSYRKF